MSLSAFDRAYRRVALLEQIERWLDDCEAEPLIVICRGEHADHLWAQHWMCRELIIAALKDCAASMKTAKVLGGEPEMMGGG